MLFRSLQFADVAIKDLSFDRLVTFGAHEHMVTERLLANGARREDVLNLGDEHRLPWDQIVDRMIYQQPSDHLLVVGFVNIHTAQAEQLLEYFEHEAPEWSAKRPSYV